MTDALSLSLEFKNALLSLDRTEAKRVYSLGIERNGAMPAMETIIGPALDMIGTAWETGELALSQVYMAGRICEELTLNTMPDQSPERKNDPLLALAVFEDQHLLGKRMVHAVLRNEGFAVADWGQTRLEPLLDRLAEEKPDILLLSCLMLSSSLRIRRLREAIDAERIPVKIVVGGAPFRLDPELWREVGADAMGATASEVTAIVRTLKGTSA